MQVGREAVAAIKFPVGLDTSLQAMCLNNLGTGVALMGERTGDLTMLEEALQLSRRAVASSAADDPRRGMRLGNLSHVLQRLGQLSGDEELWEEAVRVGREAITIASPGDADRHISLPVLGEALTHMKLMEEARQVFTTAASITWQPVGRRVSALWRAADLDLLADDHDHAVAMVELAVELIPQVVPHRLGRANREDNASRMNGLAPTVAAVLIAAGDPNRAVELLEQSRGIVLADTLDTRGDLTELRARAPKIARRFDALRQAIEAAADPDRRAELNQQWTDLLAQIRRLSGFSGFLLPLPIDRLRRHAADGPIVYVTVHRRRGHALIVVDDPDQPVRVVELPAFTKGAAEEQDDLLRDAQQTASDGTRPASERSAAQRRILEILGWLWDTVTEPILGYLGHTATPPDGDPWPRLWWCPVGISAFLPLHAAGHHSGPSTETVMDRVISSYTPTIRALSHARTPSRDHHAPSMVITAVPDAPDCPPLRGVTREAEFLQELFPTAVTLPHPNRDNVTAALPNHQIAHFACHGLVDLTAPAESRLLLHDHLDRPLTVAAIVQLRLDHGELAYLSACSTTGTSRRNADEATHITAAFQLAGYRTVIGTLWPINDHAATAIARDFYTRLSNGAGIPDPATAAAALHHTIRHHRYRYPALPTQWAAHIHTGR